LISIRCMAKLAIDIVSMADDCYDAIDADVVDSMNVNVCRCGLCDNDTCVINSTANVVLEKYRCAIVVKSICTLSSIPWMDIDAFNAAVKRSIKIAKNACNMPYATYLRSISDILQLILTDRIQGNPEDINKLTELLQTIANCLLEMKSSQHLRRFKQFKSYLESCEISPVERPLFSQPSSVKRLSLHLPGKMTAKDLVSSRLLDDTSLGSKPKRHRINSVDKNDAIDMQARIDTIQPLSIMSRLQSPVNNDCSQLASPRSFLADSPEPDIDQVVYAKQKTNGKHQIADKQRTEKRLDRRKNKISEANRSQ
jgi:hypothetical protein